MDVYASNACSINSFLHSFGEKDKYHYAYGSGASPIVNIDPP